MKFALLALAVMVAAVVVVYLVGRILPLDQLASISGELSAKHERVYGAITQLDKLTTWRSGYSASYPSTCSVIRKTFELIWKI